MTVSGASYVIRMAVKSMVDLFQGVWQVAKNIAKSLPGLIEEDLPKVEGNFLSLAQDDKEKDDTNREESKEKEVRKEEPKNDNLTGTHKLD